MRKGTIFVITGPSGVGKSTLVKELLKTNPSIKRAVTFTTRKPRAGEVDGEHYYFINRKKFDQMKEEGDFLETIEIFNNYYGTSREQIQEILRNSNCILVLDTEGAKKIMNGKNVVSIFIRALNLDVLRQRMVKRESESKENLVLRMDKVKEQMHEMQYFDHIIINNDLAIALKQLSRIIVA
jgi:guanylate kinase